jgi:hypothetical protein
VSRAAEQLRWGGGEGVSRESDQRGGVPVIRVKSLWSPVNGSTVFASRLVVGFGGHKLMDAQSTRLFCLPASGDQTNLNHLTAPTCYHCTSISFSGTACLTMTANGSSAINKQ